VLELGKLLEDSDSELKIDLLANQVRFRFANIELVSKVVDGKFPDYNRVIPSGHSKQIELSHRAVAGAATRGDTFQ
jgi:DNA polymerase-3 subunit beta